jgi:hypothetical protein
VLRPYETDSRAELLLNYEDEKTKSWRSIQMGAKSFKTLMFYPVFIHENSAKLNMKLGCELGNPLKMGVFL